MPMPRWAPGSVGSSFRAEEKAASADLVSKERRALSPWTASASAAAREPDATFLARVLGSGRGALAILDPGSGRGSGGGWGRGGGAGSRAGSEALATAETRAGAGAGGASGGDRG